MNKYQQILHDLDNNSFTWLITGVSGFIGSNILETLLLLNQKVVGLDNFSTGYESNLDQVKASVSVKQWNKFEFIKGDIRNKDDCGNACIGVDHVLHQAALGSVPRSIEDPISTNSSNIDGFLNILLSAKNHKVKSFSYAASSSTYGDNTELPKKEEKIGKPLSPYAVSKYVNELYADVFANNFNFKSIGLRYFNVFGKRQDPNGAYAAVIPKWISSMLKHEEVFINGDGSTSRDFSYVDNVVQANILSASLGMELNSENKKKDIPSLVFNVAVGERTSLSELYVYLRDSLAESYPHLKGVEPTYRDFRSGDVMHSQADISKARNLLGYQPSHSVKDGLKEAMEWYIKNLK